MGKVPIESLFRRSTITTIAWNPFCKSPKDHVTSVVYSLNDLSRTELDKVNLVQYVELDKEGCCACSMDVKSLSLVSRGKTPSFSNHGNA
jgi:hypothetical protein